MNRKTLTTIALLASLMMAVTVLAGERKLNRIHATRAAKGDILDRIYATPASEGDILDLLRLDREVVMIDAALSPPYILGPVVVTAADLDDPTITALLKEAYGVGRTVAIVDATQDEADRFQHFSGAATPANCEPADGEQTIAFYGLQASIARRPKLNSSYCLARLPELNQPRHSRNARRARSALRRWLQESFARSAPEPVASEVTDDSQNIVKLATEMHCSFLTTSDPLNQGRQLQADTYVTAARSFVNNEDIYYVENDLQYQQGNSNDPNYAFGVSRVGATGVAMLEATESESQPDSATSYTSSISNSTTTTISGSVGFNAQGPSATIGGSVSHGKSLVTTVPAILISNNTQPSPPLPQWTFESQSALPNQQVGPVTTWFWTVPKDKYSDGGAKGGALSVRSFMSMGGKFDEPVSGTFVGQWTCNVPYAFGGLWADAVGNPTITSLSPAEVAIGEEFTITGTELYSGLVTAVFLNGTEINSANVSPKGDPNNTGIFTVEVLVPSETNGSATPTGTVSVAIETTFNDTKYRSPTMPITITESE